MRVPRPWILMSVLGTAILAGCGQTGSSAAIPSASLATLVGSASSRPTPDISAPVGIIAIGHSGLTGEGTGTGHEAVLANSWATGTNPDVDSIYLRMIAGRPETEGHFANTAQGGAVAQQLLDQAQRALTAVPVPQLAIVSTIDNDIRCDGTDDAHVPDFGTQVKAAPDLFTQRRRTRGSSSSASSVVRASTTSSSSWRPRRRRRPP